MIASMYRRHAASGLARKAVTAGITCALTMGLMGCGSTTTTDAGSSAEASTESTSAASTAEIQYLDTAELFTSRDSDATYDASDAASITLGDAGPVVSGTGVAAEGNVVTISSEGTYVVSGTLSNGQLVIAAPDDAKVQVVLNGASITSEDSAALYVQSADKVFVTVAEGTDNALVTRGAYTATDEGIDGAVYAKDDLTLNGLGSLTVSSAAGHGIVGKDDVKLCLGAGGTLAVEAAQSAINANDSVRATGEGSYRLVAGTDGVHVENADDAELGYAYLAGGSFDITAESDGFDVSYIMQVDDGSLTVAAGDDGLHAEADLVVTGGTIDVSDSYEGLEGARIGIDGGDITVTASDDGLNATGDDHVNTTGDVAFDGMSDESGTTFDGDELSAPPSDFGGRGPGEGMEPPSDDMAGSGPANGQFEGRGMGGGAMMDVDDSALIQITGGTLYVNANGDGIDSNGSIVMSGGNVQVDGPVNTGNGALDGGSAITITGGTLLATSAGGMEENATSATTQPTFLVSLGTSVTGSVLVSDANGAEVASWSSDKQFNSVQMSSPKLSVGETYTITCGDTSVDVTLDDTVSGESGGMGAMGGGFMPGREGTADADGGGAMRTPGAGRRGNGGPRGQRPIDAPDAISSDTTSTDAVSG